MKSIDLGESFESPTVVESAPAKKYYPHLEVPGKIDGKLVGKKVTLVVDGVVTAVRQDARVGRKQKATFVVECHTARMPMHRKVRRSEAPQSWMDEMAKVT